jgi:hypothetical protein
LELANQVLLEVPELLAADTLEPVPGLLVVKHADKKMVSGRATFQLCLVRGPNSPDRVGEAFKLRFTAASPENVAAAVSEKFSFMNYRLVITSVRNACCFLFERCMVKNHPHADIWAGSPNDARASVCPFLIHTPMHRHSNRASRARPRAGPACPAATL